MEYDARRVIGEIKEADRKKWGEELEKEDEKGKVFRMAKKMGEKNKDVVGGGCVKDQEGKIVVEEERIKEVWRAYYEKLLIEEFDWTRNDLEEVDSVSGPI